MRGGRRTCSRLEFLMGFLAVDRLCIVENSSFVLFTLLRRPKPSSVPLFPPFLSKMSDRSGSSWLLEAGPISGAVREVERAEVLKGWSAGSETEGLLLSRSMEEDRKTVEGGGETAGAAGGGVRVGTVAVRRMGGLGVCFFEGADSDM